MVATVKPNLTRVWASGAPGANVVDPDTTTAGKFDAGWLAEVPPFEHFNFLQKLFTQGLAHNNEQGINIWDVNTLFPVGGISKGSNGNIYKAITEQSGNDPTTDNGTNWKLYISDNNKIINSTIAEMVASNHAVGQVIETVGYYDGWAATLVPRGSGNYQIATLTQIRDALGDPSFTPDELINFTIANGNIAFLLLNTSLNLFQSGARGNDSADDGPSIQASIDFVNSLSGGLILVGEGTYKFTRLNPKSHVIIRGSGSGNTFLKCTDSASTDAGVVFGSAFRKLDDGSRVSRFALQDIGLIAENQTTFANVIGLNLCGCERGDFRNVFIAHFGFSAVTLARAEGGTEGLGFTGTAGEDGNYNTFSQISLANCGQFNPDGAAFWYLFKANSNKSYGVFGKGGFDNLLVFKNGNDNLVSGGTAEACKNIATFDGTLVRSNQVSNIRGEGLSGNAYNLLNGASDNLIFPGRMTGIAGVNFNVDVATENLNRIMGAEENNLRNQTFPPVSDYATNHNKGALKATSVNGDTNYPLFVKAETEGDISNHPVVELFDDATSPVSGHILGDYRFSNRDASGGAAGVSGSFKGVIENTVGGTALVFATGTGSTLTDRWRINRLGDMLPESDGAYDMGSALLQVDNIFLVNAPVVSCDTRIKPDAKSIPQEVLDWAMTVEIQQFHKLGGDRLHFGIVIDEQFILDVERLYTVDDFGPLCHTIFKDSEDNPISKDLGDIILGDIWQIRTDEWQNILLEALRRKVIG